MLIRAFKSLKFLAFLMYIMLMPQGMLFGQPKNEFFIERISEGDNVFSIPVSDITQDELGFLWLATRMGLYRYDGHQLKAYDHVFNDGATAIAIDEQGLIWLGTFLNGVIVYDPRMDTTASLSKILAQVSISSPVADIKIDGNDVWIVCQDKVLLVNREKKRSREIISSKMTPDEAFRTVEIDQTGHAWIGKKHGVLLARNTKDSLRIIDLSSKVRFASVSAIARSRGDTLILASSIGFFEVNTRTGLSNGFSIRRGTGGSYSMAASTNAILVNPVSGIWYATIKGLYWESKGKIKTGLHEDTDPYSLSSNDVHSIFRTREGVIFVATEMGLNRIAAKKQGFDYHKFPSSQRGGSSSGNASAFYEDRQRNLWIGIEGEGLYHLDSNYHVLEIYHQTDARRDQVSAKSKPWVHGNSISAIASDESGNIWVGTNRGMASINPMRGKTSIYLRGKGRKGMSHFDGNQWIRTDSVMDSDENRISYIKPFDNFLLVQSESENTSLMDARNPDLILKRYFKNPDTINQFRPRLYEDQFGHVLALDNEGIKMFDKEMLDFRTIIPSDKVPVFVKGIIYDEERACLWILTVQSLEKFTLLDGKFESTSLLENLSHHAMLLDHMGRFWIATNRSLLVLDLTTRAVANLTEKDGLRSTRFFDGVVAKNGDFRFGDSDGLIQFNPNTLAPKKSSQTLIVTGIKAGSRMEGRKFADDSGPTGGIEYKRSITLDYFENSIRIEFTDLDLTGSSGYQYAYRIGPVDNDWVMTEDLNTDVYTRLSPGEYTFQLKRIDENGHDVGPHIEFGVVILPPPWRTWWAYSFYISAFLILVYVLWRRWQTRLVLKTVASIKSAEAKQLRELDTIKSNFFANISHEFRTPLTLLLGPIEKRLAIPPEGEDKAELNMMHRNASRLLTLVNQLLDLSRAEAGTLKLRCRLADMKEAILSVMSQFSSMASSKGISFEIVAPQPVMVFFDPDKLEKIISNLLSNAFKFTASGGSITLTITKGDPTEGFNDGFAAIVILDTGMGIEPDHLPKIFDRFYQVDMSSTRNYEGSGIGLSLTKELVELHHGSVTVSSTHGQGSEFTVRLPLGVSHLKPEEVGADPPDPFLNARDVQAYDDLEEVNDKSGVPTLPWILLVEDNKDLRCYLNGNLKQQFNLLEAENGEEGIQMALREVPDIIISDLMMPKRNGLELCQQLKEDERTCHIPIILLTAKADAETKLKGYREGADEYISKPFQMEELQVRIENLLLNRKRVQEKFAKRLSFGPQEVPVTSMDERFIKKSVEIIERFIGDSTFGVPQFALEMGVSHTQLSRKLNALTSFGPNEFIRHMRLLRAADLMHQKAGNVADIAYLVGFNNLSYFSKVFKEKFGVTPIEYLKNPPKSHSGLP